MVYMTEYRAKEGDNTPGRSISIDKSQPVSKNERSTSQEAEVPMKAHLIPETSWNSSRNTSHARYTHHCPLLMS